ncbi:hypothetical protein RclHR1_01600023 [Rhizophagus clarus]|uniref:F-box domain-containing protein n=1 Tax=Rhizophagus clarus TaxID=94130 RepID=A0A2Z6QXD3_9GLOM|nr:hypothetical protein RclHR1_01600023 [Rhizophagus clarus]
MQNQSVEQEDKTASAEQETKTISTEQEAKPHSTEQESKTNSTEQEEASSTPVEQKTNFNFAEQDNLTEQEAKTNSNLTEQETKANLTEEISLNNSTTPTPSSSSSSYLSSSHLLNLTQEVFIEVCENLHPKDLYSLTLVCKRFRTILWSKSSTTQQIWYKSRLKFVPKFSYLKPPGDLSEQKFVWLLIGETCQYCGKNVSIDSGDRRLFWEFKILTCSNCAQERTISLEKLKESHNMKDFPEEILSCLPCISETIFRNSCNFLVNATSPGYYGTNPYYWKADIFHALDEYNSLSKIEREDWVNKKQIELRDYLEVIEDMRAKENNSFLENLCKQFLPM